MKRIFMTTLFLLLVLAVVPVLSAQEDVTLTFLGGDYFDPPEEGEEPSGSYEVLQEYLAANPNVTFDARSVPFAELDSTQLAALEAGRGPDLLIINSVTIGSFIDRGYLIPLNDLIDGSGFDTSDIFDGMLKAAVFNDLIFGLPIDTGTRLLYWNKAMFEEAGLEPPTTWDELPEVAAQMADPENGVYGFVATSGERWLWLYEHAGMYTTANGLQIVNDAATECVLNQGDNVQAIQFWVDFFNSGAMSQEDLLVGTGAERELAFGNNRAAMYLGGFWSANTLETDYGMTWPDDYGIIPLEGSAGMGSSTGGWIFAISRDAQNPEVAMDFINFVLSDPENLVRFTGLMPATRSANEIALEGEFYDPFKELLAANTFHPIPLNPGLPEQAEVLRNVTQAAILGDMTAQEAADSFCEQIEGTLFPSS
ncbi:MAG: hypothetical protein CL610_28405 [Anaerolineaceae bacterium]|nr:hypothetical protein [Anaerolineaceae bacterium]